MSQLEIMRIRPVIRVLLGAAVLTALGFETGLLQRAFDSRSVLEDGVVGSEFWIEEVDGKPVERVRHGFVISRIPFALVEPGERVLGFPRRVVLLVKASWWNSGLQLREG